MKRTTYKKDSNEATREATPQTMTVALVRFNPVPPPEAPPGISTSPRSRTEELNPAQGVTQSGVHIKVCNSSKDSTSNEHVFLATSIWKAGVVD